MFGQYENFQFKSSSYSKAEYEWEIKLQIFFILFYIIFFNQGNIINTNGCM